MTRMVGVDALDARGRHQAHVVDDSLEVPYRHEHPGATRVGVDVAPQMRGDAPPREEVGIGFLDSGIRMGPVREIAVFDRSEEDDQVLRQPLARRQERWFLGLGTPIREGHDQNTGMAGRQQVAELEDVVVDGAARAAVLVLQRPAFGAMAEPARMVCGGDGDGDTVLADAPDVLDVLEDVPGQRPAQGGIAEAELSRHAFPRFVHAEEIGIGLEVVLLGLPGKDAGLAVVGCGRDVGERRVHPACQPKDRRRPFRPVLRTGPAEGHVHTVLPVEVRIVQSPRVPVGEREAPFAVERRQGNASTLGDHRFLKDRIPAPAQRILEKLHHGIQAAVNALAVEEDVRPDAAGNMLLLFEPCERVRAEPLQRRRAQTDEDRRGSADQVIRPYH